MEIVKGKKKEKELQRIRNEVFKAIGVIYIELFVSKPLPTFQESNESFEEGWNVEREILKALQ